MCSVALCAPNPTRRAPARRVRIDHRPTQTPTAGSDPACSTYPSRHPASPLPLRFSSPQISRACLSPCPAPPRFPQARAPPIQRVPALRRRLTRFVWQGTGRRLRAPRSEHRGRRIWAPRTRPSSAPEFVTELALAWLVEGRRRRKGAVGLICA